MIRRRAPTTGHCARSSFQTTRRVERRLIESAQVQGHPVCWAEDFHGYGLRALFQGSLVSEAKAGCRAVEHAKLSDSMTPNAIPGAPTA